MLFRQNHWHCSEPSRGSKSGSSRTTRALRLNGPPSAPAVNASSAKPMLSSLKIVNFDKNIQNVCEISQFEAEKITIRIFTLGTARAPPEPQNHYPGHPGHSRLFETPLGLLWHYWRFGPPLTVLCEPGHCMLRC